MFLSGAIIRRERENVRLYLHMLTAYVKMRARFLSTPDDPGAELRDAWADLVDAFETSDADDKSFAPMLKHERERLLNEILKRAGEAKDVSLSRLCEMGEADAFVMADLKNAQGAAIDGLTSTRFLQNFRKSKMISSDGTVFYVSGKDPEFAKRLVEEFEAGFRRIKAFSPIRISPGRRRNEVRVRHKAVGGLLVGGRVLRRLGAGGFLSRRDVQSAGNWRGASLCGRDGRHGAARGRRQLPRQAARRGR